MKIIAANWKMNNSFDECDEWLDKYFANYVKNIEKFNDLEIVLCAPNVLLDYIDSELMEGSMQHLEELMKKQDKSLEDFSESELNDIILGSRPLKLGAQDCHHQQKGAFTGSVSADMLAKIGCEYVIVGHSERRQGCFEDDKLISQKIAASLEKNLTPIICVGESAQIRKEGKHLEFIENQIKQTLANNNNFLRLVIAYEPIWAIGTGVVPTNEQILEMAELINNLLKNNYGNIAKEHYLLYGGSVKEANAKSILQINGINGLLVGGASIDCADFMPICLS